MKIKKILNQNAVLVDDAGEEKVAIGKGIGFNKKRNDRLFPREIERLFVLEPEGQMKLQSLLNQIDSKYLFAAEKIIDQAETLLMEKLSEHLLIALTDHLAFAAENLKNGIIIRNKLLPEIEVLYPEEFRVAQWAVEYLTQTLQVPYTYDEAGYIAIHLHSARAGERNKHQSIREVTIVSEIVQLIEKDLATDLHTKEMLLNYTRVVNHLRLLLQRFHKQQYATLDVEIVQMVKEKYPASFETAKKIRVLLLKNYQLSTTSEELGYLAIHIERLRLAKNEKQEEKKE
ncbi:PRD domain-containing protein [Enterococcus sp. LJL98]